MEILTRFQTAPATLRTQPAFTVQTIPPLATLQLSSNALQTKAHFTPQSELSYAPPSIRQSFNISRYPLRLIYQHCYLCFIISQPKRGVTVTSAPYVFIDNTTVLQFGNSDSEKKKLVDESHNNQLNMKTMNRSSEGKAVPPPEQAQHLPTLAECLLFMNRCSLSSFINQHLKIFHRQDLHHRPSPPSATPSPIPSSSTSTGLPQEFTYMKNECEIAAWVSDHKRILDLAISIRKTKRQRIDDGEDDDVGKMIGNDRREIEDRLYVEARALFLRTRNTSAELLENMASEILNKKASHPTAPDVGENFECAEQPSVPSKQTAQTTSRRI
ncbi:7903_t:CDS:2 [Paraglomus occultum]|uniref:7903_t:CDS:1 n=1 Tax=Paraglomus occultum TaxID=144539 RepID=A0A9N9CYY2_9GLOM|nr:7903_t:CDS:2 [Paraglomus occultum]